MGNICCSGESLSNDERKELDQLQEKKYEYPQRVEISVPTHRASEAKGEGDDNQWKTTLPIKSNETSASSSEENDYSQQILDDAMWPPPTNQPHRDGTNNYSGIQNKTLPPPPPPLESYTATGLNDSIGHNIWPPPPTDSYTNGNNADNFVPNIWPPPPSDSQTGGGSNVKVLNANNISNTLPSTSANDNKTPAPLEGSEDDAMFTSNIWPPPANSQGFSHSYLANTDSLQSADDIQQNIWPPPSSSNNSNPSSQSYGIDHVTPQSPQKPNEDTYDSPPNTKDIITVNNQHQFKPEKPHIS